MNRPVIAIAGARGFIGQALVQSLQSDNHVIALTRHPPKEQTGEVEWRKCDLFSLKQAEEALHGAEIAIYLVHSMIPQAKLTQAGFDDLDLLCADNFARAAKKCGVKRIVYLGGLIPDDERLSAHLRSRREVEETLRAHGVPVTVLRAGLIFGWRGSSFQILYKLVRRLPVMILPRWTLSLTQPIALSDVMTSFRYSLEHPETAGGTYDLLSVPALSYADLLKRTARFLGKKLHGIDIPFFTPTLSVLWVRLVTGANKQLIRPLVGSLKHSMVAESKRLLPAPKSPHVFYEDILKEALDGQPKGQPYRFSKTVYSDKDVRSVQRLPLPPGWNASDVAKEYMKWIGNVMRPFFKVTMTDKGECDFSTRFVPLKLLSLHLSLERSSTDRPIFYITGGVLAHEVVPDRLEFREVLGRRFVLAAIHDFRPRLPWLLYRLTQAIIHGYVMRRFGKHLEKIA